MPQSPKFVIFAHNATYDKLHQVATLGLTAAAMGKDVIVVLLFWTIKKLAEGKIDQIDFPPEYAASADEVARLLKEKKVPKISEMLQEAKLVGKFRLIACSAGLEYMGVDGAAVEANVDEVLGLPAILSLTAEAETKLFI
jgi:peroxiredoxin family protein